MQGYLRVKYLQTDLASAVSRLRSFDIDRQFLQTERSLHIVLAFRLHENIGGRRPSCALSVVL